MDDRENSVNGEVYQNARKRLKMSGCREDLVDVADQLKNNKELVYVSYKNRGIGEVRWDDMYRGLLKLADRKAAVWQKNHDIANRFIGRKSLFGDYGTSDRF
ncbi:MAG: hypothetical protein KJ592_02295 [Nanoarchaeota archaeon]|nr:hypothetical protein [Nanoarchaeota archaeon]